MMADVVAKEHPSVVWWAPQLPPSPRAALHMVLEGIAQWPVHTMAVVGSSLGGFYATQVSQIKGCRCVVLNPAVDPARDLEKHIGEHTFWHAPKERFYFAPEYVQELRAMNHGALLNPQHTLAVVAKGDEVLDWRDMRTRYADCRMRLIEGSDHGLSDFADHLPFVLEFLNLA
jgi:predicted esterase YcpF (UPF0227 family)